MLADLSECDRLAEKARDGRGLAVIWEIPTKSPGWAARYLGNPGSNHKTADRPYREHT